MMNVEWSQAAADPQTRPNDPGCESACRLPEATPTIVICYYYSAWKLILILPSCSLCYYYYYYCCCCCCHCQQPTTITASTTVVPVVTSTTIAAYFYTSAQRCVAGGIPVLSCSSLRESVRAFVRASRNISTISCRVLFDPFSPNLHQQCIMEQK